MNERGFSEVEEDLSRLGEAMRNQPSLADRVVDDWTAQTERQELDSTDVSHSKQFRNSWFGEVTMMQKVSFGSLTAALLLVAGIWLATSTATMTLAQVVEQVRKATSYSADMKMIPSGTDADKPPAMKGKMFWRAPDDLRVESQLGNAADPESVTSNHQVRITFRDRDGIFLNVKQKSWGPISPQQGMRSPILTLQNLSDFRDDASKELGTREIGGLACEGFEIELDKVDRNVGAGTMELWVDSTTHLPAELTIRSSVMPGEMVLTNFVWNSELDAELFSIVPPEGYRDQREIQKESGADDLDEKEILERMVSAFRLYASLNDGKYPQVDMIYGDVTMAKMLKLGGYEGQNHAEWRKEKKYRQITRTSLAWSFINSVMTMDADASYHGLEVSPGDKDKVLFRWSFGKDQYQVIYGDLHAEILPKK